MGGDGNGLTTSNGLVATDAFGYSLDYYNGDYRGIGGSQFLAKEDPSDDFITASLNGGLYNGNIARMVTALCDTSETPMDVVGNAYTYDQLNRLIMKNAYVRAGMHLPGNDNWTGVSVTTNYKEKFIYDSNGNILSLLRYAEGTNPMENLTYHYNPGTNQLQFVEDAIADGDYTVDIDDQDTLNYRYDKNGNLVFDAAEEIDTIRWTVSGKIEAVIRASASSKPSLYFYYDALGNRSIKQVVPASGNQTFEFYKRDATGNILATYKMADSSGTKTLQLKQRQLYGSSRLGVITQEVRIAENASWPNVFPTQDTANAPFVLWNADSTYQDSVYINPFDSVGYKIKVNKYLGFRNYELSNHLGNVLAVISDRKYGEDADTDGELELFKPNVLSETDYYAFGSEVKERSVRGGYKFGFNGMEIDLNLFDEWRGLNFTGTRIYNSYINRWLSMDSKTMVMPFESPYSFSNNTPIIGNDKEGEICVPCLILVATFVTAPEVLVAPTGKESDQGRIKDARSFKDKWLLMGIMGSAYATRVVTNEMILKNISGQLGINISANLYSQFNNKKFKSLGSLMKDAIMNVDIADAFLGNISKSKLVGSVMSASVDLTVDEYKVLGIDKDKNSATVDLVMNVIGDHINLPDAKYSEILDKVFKVADNKIREELNNNGGDYEGLKNSLGKELDFDQVNFEAKQDATIFVPASSKRIQKYKN